ncbi:DNA-deoxyinosine glycosylase, partial [Xanthomonas sp. Kuri4-2]
MTEASLLRGLAAQVKPDCRVLVLGSMPGTASLDAARYYAHPRNRFWPLLGVLLGLDAAAAYPVRLAAMQARGVGLWDVIGTCARRGSLDAAIDPASVVPNPIPALLARLPQLRAVACNGSTAHQAWRRHVQPQLRGGAFEALPVLSLPSTSPANAAFSLDRLR